MQTYIVRHWVGKDGIERALSSCKVTAENALEAILMSLPSREDCRDWAVDHPYPEYASYKNPRATEDAADYWDAEPDPDFVIEAEVDADSTTSDISN